MGGVYYGWLRRYQRSRDLAADVAQVRRGFASGSYGGPRDYYRRALMLAQVILGADGLGFAGNARIHGDAILLQTASIFERYLRNVIRNAYNDQGFVVTKGGVGTMTLYTDGTFELTPDIVVSRDARTLLILDAKYKKPTASDHYQLYAYLAASRTSRGVLLAPLYEGSELEIREYSTGDNMVVREVFLPMTNLRVTEAFLGQVVQKFA